MPLIRIVGGVKKVIPILPGGAVPQPGPGTGPLSTSTTLTTSPTRTTQG